MGETVEYKIIIVTQSGDTIEEPLLVDSSLEDDMADDMVARHVFHLLHYGVAMETISGERAISPFNIASIEWVRPAMVLEA